jgi:hypothetical protein
MFVHSPDPDARWRSGQMLAAAAEQAMRHPEAVFRNPAKLAEARRILAQHHQAFMDLFGADLIVVPGTEVPGKVAEFHRHLAQRARPGAEPPSSPHWTSPATSSPHWTSPATSSPPTASRSTSPRAKD